MKATETHVSFPTSSNSSTIAVWISATIVLSMANKKVDDEIQATTRLQESPLIVRVEFPATASLSLSVVALALAEDISSDTFSASGAEPSTSCGLSDVLAELSSAKSTGEDAMVSFEIQREKCFATKNKFTLEMKDN
ncbi:hypothetical protein BELL_0411g00010 [Botrytis elliptica]|uniref:Uncharacterized protein n=1 Tax=Botrytis elliptica TaxID=278938 RepID=A0A4Z1JGM9_9HELO|nr:hypothetical protein BELL_0411g00010 [Botrytis elliptica]